MRPGPRETKAWGKNVGRLQRGALKHASFFDKPDPSTIVTEGHLGFVIPGNKKNSREEFAGTKSQPKEVLPLAMNEEDSRRMMADSHRRGSRQASMRRKASQLRKTSAK